MLAIKRCNHRRDQHAGRQQDSCCGYRQAGSKGHIAAAAAAAAHRCKLASLLLVEMPFALLPSAAAVTWCCWWGMGASNAGRAEGAPRNNLQQQHVTSCYTFSYCLVGKCCLSVQGAQLQWQKAVQAVQACHKASVLRHDGGVTRFARKAPVPVRQPSSFQLEKSKRQT